MLVIIAVAFAVIVLSTVVYQRCKHKECSSRARLDGKTALVTGGTAGMGLEVAAELARRGARVLVASPFVEEGRTALVFIQSAASHADVQYLPLDLGSLADTRHFAAELLEREPALHLLINNAAIGGPGGLTSADGHDLIMQVNYFGPALLTLLLLPLLRASGKGTRIVNVASGLHFIGNININRLNRTIDSSIKAYSNSKLCLVMFTRELAWRLRGQNVVVNSLEPGVVGTQIYGTWNKYVGFLVSWIACLLCKTPWQGAQTTLHVALDEAAGLVSGEYFAECSIFKAAVRAHDEKLSARLWDETLRLINMSPEEVKNSFSS